MSSLFFSDYKITKPIRLIEFFAGIGSQYKALKLLTDKVEHYKICEWAYNSIIGYNAIHCKDNTDYSEGKTKEEMIARITGISTNYSDPLTLEQLNKKPIEWIKSAYNNCIATKNLINIMDVKGEDLEIVDTDKYDYIISYSFPCQDLSLAGLKKGMKVSQAQGGTRSGLLWEVERILDELNALGKNHLPRVLLMENVPEVVSVNNIKDMQKWESKLMTLGYRNHIKILNAKDFGIPQNRRRCFMISILTDNGDDGYTFPTPIPLKYRLKHMLQNDVDEKFYLTQRAIDKIANWKAQQDPLKDIDKEKEICPTLTARGAGEDHSGMVLINEDTFEDVEHNASDLQLKVCKEAIDKGLVKPYDTIDYSYSSSRLSEMENGDLLIRNATDNSCMCTITTKVENFGVCVEDAIPIIENTKQGYKLAKDGDGVAIDGRMANHRGNVQDGLAHTILTTGGNDVGVVIKDDSPETDKIVQIGKYTPGGFSAGQIVSKNGVAPTVKENHGTVTAIIENGEFNEDDDLNLKQQLCEKLIEDGLVKEYDIVKHSYTTRIMEGKKKCVESSDEMITLTTRGDCVGVVVPEDTESMFTDTEKQLFTDDGNIKRYLHSDIVDEFKEGQMATTTYPNGYGHGPRTHDDSIALNTIDRPCVKQHLRIRKLTPKECTRLMGFEDCDYEALASVGLTNSAIYHVCGDSIVVTVLAALFSNLINDNGKYKTIIENYVETIKE